MNTLDVFSIVLFGISVILLVALVIYIKFKQIRFEKRQKHKDYYAFIGAFNIDNLKQRINLHGEIKSVNEEISNGGPDINSINKIKYRDFGICNEEKYIDLRW